MFMQLVDRMVHNPPALPPGTTWNQDTVVGDLLQSDPYDILLAVDEAWTVANPVGIDPLRISRARSNRHLEGAFHPWAQGSTLTHPRPWDHLIYAYTIENTRAVQIFSRLVREFRTGEGLGVASVETQRWLDITEALLFAAPSPFPAFQATSQLRMDPEAVRRNAYSRMFNMDLAFGMDGGGGSNYLKALTLNTAFGSLLEELLYELWRAMTNSRNSSGVNDSDNDRIYRLSEELAFVLNERTQNATLAREELAAVAVASWIELTLDSNNRVITDLRAEGTSPDGRLKLIGDRVKLAAHSRTDSLMAMAHPLSVLLRTIQIGVVKDQDYAYLLYESQMPPGSPVVTPPIGTYSKRVITEWSAATGRDLKARKTPVTVQPGRQLATSTR